MDWYYASGSDRMGPVDGERLKELVSIGDVKPETLVWREGMENWGAYSTVMGELGGVAESGPTGAVQRCSYSGEMRPESEMLRYGEKWVAVEHKDAFVASLQAGRDLGGGERVVERMDYVGFWWRVLSKLIDGVIFLVVLAICAVPAFLVAGGSIGEFFDGGGDDGAELVKFFVIIGLGVLFWFGLNCFYATWMVGKYGATVGKMAIGIKVVGADGSKVSYMRAFARFWAEIGHSFVFGMVGGVVGAVLMLPFMAMTGGEDAGAAIVVQVFATLLQYGIGYAGYYWAGFHKEKATIHDLICATRVVRK